MNGRNRAQLRIMKDLEEMQNDPPYVKSFFVFLMWSRE